MRSVSSVRTLFRGSPLIRVVCGRDSPPFVKQARVPRTECAAPGPGRHELRLVEAHAALDAAVAAAYGWPADITDDDTLRELLGLNGS